MSWSEPRARRVVLGGLACLLLPACSIRPLYGGPQGEELSRELAAVSIEPAEARLGQVLRNDLLEELNPAGLEVPALYGLTVSLDRAQNALAIQLDDVATRYDLSLAATFELTEKGSGRVLYRSAVRRVASYNVVSEPYATLVAERDAERRAARELSRQIRTQLSLYFARRPQ
jgi:LPS-assembly lipoprotein